MALDSLPNLPDRSFVIIDANVFIYALTAQSAECRQLLERCLREEVTGIALLETVNEQVAPTCPPGPPLSVGNIGRTARLQSSPAPAQRIKMCS